MWMVINYNQFTRGSPLGDNALVVLEQLPGHIVHEDLTPLLWYSYA